MCEYDGVNEMKRVLKYFFLLKIAKKLWFSAVNRSILCNTFKVRELNYIASIKKNFQRLQKLFQEIKKRYNIADMFDESL